MVSLSSYTDGSIRSERLRGGTSLLVCVFKATYGTTAGRMLFQYMNPYSIALYAFANLKVD